jgi:hypothetical protein
MWLCLAFVFRAKLEQRLAAEKAEERYAPSCYIIYTVIDRLIDMDTDIDLNR